MLLGSILVAIYSEFDYACWFLLDCSMVDDGKIYDYISQLKKKKKRYDYIH